MKTQQGFTLVEIAIVLVIVSLILGGIIKGQELLGSARVRAISNEINNTRTAWYAFQDRFNALPGDFSQGDARIGTSVGGVGNTDGSGDGDGRVDSRKEVGLVWDHLSEAGFISGEYNGQEVDSLTDLACDGSICPANPYSGRYKIVYGNQAQGSTVSSHEFFTGDNLPVNILLQLDTKLDDGNPIDGDFRSHSSTSANCVSGNSWNITVDAVSCGGVMRRF